MIDMDNELDDLLSAFEADCDDALRIFYHTMSLYNTRPDIGITADMKDMIIENIIVKIWNRWERFLEDTFIAYMMGKHSTNGDTVHSFVAPIDEMHAYDMVKNVAMYPDWSDVDKVVKNAKNFFENKGPFIHLENLRSTIKEIKTVRNAIAHSSRSAQLNFEQLVRGKTGRSPQGVTPAIFLSERKAGRAQNDPIYLQFYIDHLKNTARMLIEFHSENSM